MKELKVKRVIVAMSGGVDSSVAVALLKEAGYDVVGIHMKFWTESDGKTNRCCTPESEKMARVVAKKIGMPFYVLNFKKEFKKSVVDYFISTSKQGLTPNPCVVCNKEIKFGLLLKKAKTLGADFIATGHYAIVNDGKLFKGRDKNKDQSYFLWQLNQKQLNHVLFPIGGYTKEEVRALAKEFNLPTANTQESQEVCFVSSGVSDFLGRYIRKGQGDIINLSGKVLGEHNGLYSYTIGQRKGIGIASRKPYFVLRKDLNKNELVVTQNEKDLLRKELNVKDARWISGYAPKFPAKVSTKIRYRAKEADAVIYKLQATNFKLSFTKPQRAITPGQSVVFYNKGELLGGGIIE